MKKILLIISIVSLFAISTIMILNAYDVVGKEKKVQSNIKLIGDIDLAEIITSIKSGKKDSSNSVIINNAEDTVSNNNIFINNTNIIRDEYSNKEEDFIIDIDKYVIAERESSITIVIDDCGNTLSRYKEYIDLARKYNITFAIMPDSPHATKFDSLCYESGVNTIIHVPMQNRDAKYFGEKTIIKTYMDYEEISNLLDYSFNIIPNATGINNHTGSLATADVNTVSSVVRFLKTKDKYFFDSLTTGGSVVSLVASNEHIKTAKRDIFLDNVDTYEAVLNQWKALIKLAKKNGNAIAIGHYWSENTFYVLSNELPNIYKEGIITKNIKEVVK